MSVEPTMIRADSRKTGHRFRSGHAKFGGRRQGALNRGTIDVMALARMHGRDAIATLVDLMRNAEFEAVQVAACRELLDRAYGKPTVAVEGSVAAELSREMEVLLSFDDAAASVHKRDE